MIVLLWLAGCGSADGETTDDTFSCERVCPAGTAVATSQQIEEGYDLDAAGDPSEYEGQIAFATFVEGRCTWTCATIQPCPPETFPVITEECFTCAALADGEIVQGGCGA